MALVVVIAAFWAGMRATDIRDGVARQFEPVLSVPAPLATTPLGDVGRGPGIAAVPTSTMPDPRAPEVRVYSYPGPGETGSPAPMYRLRGRRNIVDTTASERAPAPAAVDFVNFAVPPSRTAVSTRTPMPAAQETPPDMRGLPHTRRPRALTPISGAETDAPRRARSRSRSASRPITRALTLGVRRKPASVAGGARRPMYFSADRAAR